MNFNYTTTFPAFNQLDCSRCGLKDIEGFSGKFEGNWFHLCESCKDEVDGFPELEVGQEWYMTRRGEKTLLKIKAKSKYEPNRFVIETPNNQKYNGSLVDQLYLITNRFSIMESALPRIGRPTHSVSRLGDVE